MAELEKSTDAVNELCPIALSDEDSAILRTMIKRERERRVIRSWLTVIGRRAREWAVAYVAIGTAIVAGREQIVTFLHWIGLGGGPK